MKVYTRLGNELALFDVGVDDYLEAIGHVRIELGDQHQAPVLALFENPLRAVQPAPEPTFTHTKAPA